MSRISILGSTGSIGTQTLDVVRWNLDIEVVALAAGQNIKVLADQIKEFKPRLVCVAREDLIAPLRALTGDLVYDVCYGMEGLVRVATIEEADTVVTAIVGMMGIVPTIEAIRTHHNIALANKETLVTAGHIIMPLAKEYDVKILPVDSEHSAIFQSLQGENYKTIEKILLTASGGPFRGWTKEQLANVKLEDALKHPNWAMGRKITIDSSTMVNKGLEVMEAKWLFDVDIDDVTVVVQPQSIIHSAVSFIDGSIIAQLGCPDMRLPIQYALCYPERRQAPMERLDLFKLGQITFEEPNLEVFSGLRLALEAGRTGGNMPTVFNAANEYAVARFLAREIPYLKITQMIEESMQHVDFISNPSVEEILATEQATYKFLHSMR